MRGKVCSRGCCCRVRISLRQGWLRCLPVPGLLQLIGKAPSVTSAQDYSSEICSRGCRFTLQRAPKAGPAFLLQDTLEHRRRATSRVVSQSNYRGLCAASAAVAPVGTFNRLLLCDSLAPGCCNRSAEWATTRHFCRADASYDERLDQGLARRIVHMHAYGAAPVLGRWQPVSAS